MHYKPLLLALMLCFAAPSFASSDTAKNKNATTQKTTKSKKESAETPKAKKDNSKKDNSKNTAAKAKAAEKPTAGKNSNDAKPARKADNQTAAKPDSKAKTAADKNSRKSTTENTKNRSNTTKADSKPSEKKEAVKAKEPVKAAEKKAAASNNRAVKTPTKAEPEPKNTRATHSKSSTQAAPKAAESNNRAAANNNDTPELRAAVSAATNDLEDKKALLKRTECFLIRVNANLKELQQARSNLSNINRQQRDAWERLQKLNTDLTRLKAEVSNTRAQVSRFVSGHYKNTQPNAVALFLKNAEPGQKTRFLRYTRYINSANEQVVKDLAKQQKELTAQENRINAELGRLKKLQAGAQANLQKQGAKNTAEQVESRRQNAKMAQEAKKVVNQKDNEQRLNNLLSDLDKRKAAQRQKEAEARQKAAEARLAAAEKARQAQAAEKKAAEQRAALSNLTDDDMKLQAPASGSFVSVSNANSFSRMQGRLKKPVTGMLSGLFGQSRGNGDIWKGVFYQTAPAFVSSIAAGNVTYAGNLEGYGNVVVVDHGDQYVSVYSGLSQMNVASGYSVGAGHQLGTSGKLPDGEEGLYLEIRYKGQNMNPLSWIN